MKKLNSQTQKSTLGGAKHYHWRCTVNNFRSAKYTNINSCYTQASAHGDRYGHNAQTSVISCTGNC